jgi:hypothetical protein
MKTEEYNKGVSFRVPNATYGFLGRAVSGVSGVFFTQKRRFFWSGEDVGAEFVFRGHAFEIQTDGWDGALWIMAKDGRKHEVEMKELRDAVERFDAPPTGFFRWILTQTFT